MKNSGQIRNLKIKDWALEDRPREKLLAKGISSLSDAELIAILIGSGNTNESAVELSKKILKSVNNNLNELGKLNVSDLQYFKGIGQAKAINIIAALELGRRNTTSDIIQKPKIQSSKDVFDLLHSKISHIPHEEFWVVYLNRSNKIIDKLKISQGGVAGTVADLRIIMKHAIEKLASSIILVHNHPSGNNKPSKNDSDITQKLKDAGKTIDINVLDHIIITEENYYSFADNGLI
ncbi:MAG: JAB domain-containing protein [Chlorobi bacterium]|nr:JAB domain-containing protein [Chlorobiota bacterium]